jgi:alpha-tubulin suppressor-like RCC1 family protein
MPRLIVGCWLVASVGGCSNEIDERPMGQVETEPPLGSRPVAKVEDVCVVAQIGEQVVFDATQSRDEDDDPLTYRWELVAGPIHEVTLLDPTSATPTFIPEVRGNYSFRLIVNDGQQDSNAGGSTVKSVSVYSMQPVTTAKKVATGSSHFLVLMADQTVHGWGCNHRGQTGSGAIVSNAVDIDAGHSHSLAILPDGSVQAWGSGGVSDFDDESSESCGTLPCARTPVPVGGLFDITQVVGGLNVTFALDTDGTVWRPGSGSSRPPATAWTTGIRSLGVDFGARTDGTIWTPDSLELSEPLTGIVQVSSVDDTSRLALRDDGSVWFVGSYGTVVEMTGLPPIVDIAAGTHARLALDDQGNVWDVAHVLAGPLLSDAVDIAAGRSGPAAAVKSDGTVWTWGPSNFDGELGDGTSEPRDGPVQVAW